VVRSRATGEPKTVALFFFLDIVDAEQHSSIVLGTEHFTHTHTTQEVTMGDSTKSPYELRAELLGMAIGILESQTQRKAENEYMLPEGQRKPVDHFTLSQVLDVAARLNEFVSKG